MNVLKSLGTVVGIGSVAYIFNSLTATEQKRGLRNFGASCYINAIIQALSTSRNLQNYLESTENHSEYNKILLELICYVQSDSDKNFADLLQKFMKILQPKFETSHQQDCHEFFIGIIEKLHQQHQELANHVKSLSRIPEKVPEFPFDMTICQLTSCRACKSCGQFKVTYSPYIDVKPGHNNSAVNSLENLLTKRTHTMTELHYAKCEKCKRTEIYTGIPVMVKNEAICRCPASLLVYIDRVDINPFGVPVKNSSKVNFNELLTLTNFQNLVPETPKIYELKAIIVHIGVKSIEFGHYVCYKLIGNEWYYCNDTCVQKVQTFQALNSEAYLSSWFKNF